jgi:DNA-binding protein HU-beta
VNKSQLIDALAARYEGNRKAAAHALDSVLDTITREVAKGEKVAITGFGSFEKRIRPARWVRNPRTGERLQAKKTAVPRFTPGADLRNIISGAKKLPKLSLSSLPPVPGMGRRAKAAPEAAPAKPAPAASTAPAATEAAKKPATKKSTAKKAPAKSASATKKTAAKSTTAKKTATKATSTAAKKSTAKKTTATSTASKSTAAKKSPAKKTSTTAKKTATKSTTAKKTTAKKAPAKKA